MSVDTPLHLASLIDYLTGSPAIFSSLRSDDILLSFSSLYWISGLACLLAGTLQGITRIVTTAPFSPATMLRCCSKYGVTVTLCAPSHLGQLLQLGQQLIDTDLSALRSFYVAGGSLAPELALRMNAYLPSDVLNVYGMSEVAGKITCNTPETAREPTSVGLLIAGMRARILRDVSDDDDEADGEAGTDTDAVFGDLETTANAGERCDVDEDGEICVQMHPPFIGYWNNAEATEAAHTGDGEWFRTGDIGHFDGAGRLYVVDRKKDLLKYMAVQVSPTELETVILAAVPGVAAVCVVGIADSLAGDLPAAVVVRAAGAEVGEREVSGCVEQRLSDAKRLRGGVYFVESLPVTHSGKVLRRRVAEMAAEMFAARRIADGMGEDDEEEVEE